MTNVISLDDRRNKPDPTPMVEITIMDDGEVDVWLSDDIYTTEQFNWVSSKVFEAMSRLINTKAERTGKL